MKPFAIGSLVLIIGCSKSDVGGCYSWVKTQSTDHVFEKKEKSRVYENKLSAGEACFTGGNHLIVTKYSQDDESLEMCYHWMAAVRKLAAACGLGNSKASHPKAIMLAASEPAGLWLGLAGYEIYFGI